MAIGESIFALKSGNILFSVEFFNSYLLTFKSLIMDIIVGLVALVFGVLQIILFFKIWGMTNDVSDIKDLLIQQRIQSNSITETNESSSNEEKTSKTNQLHVGQLVVLLSTEEQMKIMEITSNGYYACYTNSGSKFHGNYSAKEIEDFETYWNKKKSIK